MLPAPSEAGVYQSNSPANNLRQIATTSRVVQPFPHIQPPHTAISFCHVANGLHDHRIHAVGADIFHEATIDLNDIGLQPLQALKVGIAGTKVVYGNAEAVITQLLDILMLLPESEKACSSVISMMIFCGAMA